MADDEMSNELAQNYLELNNYNVLVRKSSPMNGLIV